MSKYLESSEATPSTAALPLTEQQVSDWRVKGACVVEGLFPTDFLEKVIADATDALDVEFEGKQDFGSNGQCEFPSRIASLNDITLHPRVLDACEQLLGTSDIRLTQSDAWRKVYTAKPYGPQDNRNQRIHCDYLNHTLVHPPPFDQPEAVAMIIYYSNVEDAGGATAVVPRTGDDDPLYAYPISQLPGFGAVPFQNDRDAVEAYFAKEDPETHAHRAQLYERERYVKYGRGTVLFYRHDAWHRGTPLKEGGVRYVHNLVFKRANTDWLNHWNTGSARKMLSPEGYFERFVAGATVQQRSALGFPAPGHSYWTEKTLGAVSARYEPLGMDMAPYRLAWEAQQ